MSATWRERIHALVARDCPEDPCAACERRTGEILSLFTDMMVDMGREIREYGTMVLNSGNGHAAGCHTQGSYDAEGMLIQRIRKELTGE